VARPIKTALLVALSITSLGPLGSLVAKDLGTQGKVYNIVEIDMREILMRSLARVDWDSVEKRRKQAALTYLDRLPRRELPLATRTETQWMDPSIALSQDILIPYKDGSGEYQWRVFYPKGHRVNPLEKSRPNTAMLFFDARVEEQVKWVAQVSAKWPGKVELIELSGSNPDKLSLKVGVPVFHASPPLLARFQIEKSPTFVYPGSGNRSLYIGKTAVAPPYNLAILDAAWPEGLNAPQLKGLPKK
jgi:hypothetical protein